MENGGSPFTFGTTDGSGNWSVSNVETSGYIGSYNQVWYVDGSPLTPINPNATFLPYAPSLPAFQVYGNFGGSNCPGGSTSSTCGGAVRWIYSPVSYRNNSASVDAPTVANAASVWTTAAGGKISVTGPGPLSQVDLSIYNGSSLPGGANADVLSYGYNCGARCYNLRNECTTPKNCHNANGVYYTDMRLDISAITTQASYLGTTFATLVPMVVKHEMGHVLRLGHAAVGDGKCSDVQSVMYPSASVLWGCGVTSPTACDTTGINTVYPTAAPYCAPGANYCISGSPSCS